MNKQKVQKLYDNWKYMQNQMKDQGKEYLKLPGKFQKGFAEEATTKMRLSS